MNWKLHWNESAFVRNADLCWQVGRTFRQKAYSDEEIAHVINKVLRLLQANADKELLDLACGNGMLTSRIAQHFKSVVGVDFSVPLIESARQHSHRENIDYLVGNVLDLGELGRQFDCIMLYCAFQYFSPRQAEILFSNVERMLTKSGIVLLGDVADGDRRWKFYKGLRGRCRFLVDVIRNKPIIGYWWKPSDLHRLAERHQLRMLIHYQEKDSPNYYFRYDAVLQRKPRPVASAATCA